MNKAPKFTGLKKNKTAMFAMIKSGKVVRIREMRPDSSCFYWLYQDTGHFIAGFYFATPCWSIYSKNAKKRFQAMKEFDRDMGCKTEFLGYF